MKKVFLSILLLTPFVTQPIPGWMKSTILGTSITAAGLLLGRCATKAEEKEEAHTEMQSIKDRCFESYTVTYLDFLRFQKLLQKTITNPVAREFLEVDEEMRVSMASCDTSYKPPIWARKLAPRTLAALKDGAIDLSIKTKTKFLGFGLSGLLALALLDAVLDS